MSPPQPLHELLTQLRTIQHSLPLLPAPRPPILNGDRGEVEGLRAFRDAVAREVEVLEQFVASGREDAQLSTNAPYFVAVWGEIVGAAGRVVAVGKVFGEGRAVDVGAKGIRFNAKADSNVNARLGGGVKVDVVADEGRAWIRVNTMKNSRFLAELRELDSYLTSDSDSDSEPDDSFRPTRSSSHSLPPTTLFHAARALLAASHTQSPRPRITLRLTRLQPHTTDPRVGQTVDAIRALGVDVQLGETAFRGLASPSPTPCLRPTPHINIDLSALIALASDLVHTPLPATEDAAWARFRVRGGGAGSGEHSKTDTSSRDHGTGAGSEGYTPHSRALALQCVQEMRRGVVDEIVGHLEEAQEASKEGRGGIEFWTTSEARARCLQIVDKIGGEGERRRARAMFAVDDMECARENFWRGSRYGGDGTFFPSLLPIRVHPRHMQTRVPSAPFWGRLGETCREILEEDKESNKDSEKGPVEERGCAPAADGGERARTTRTNAKLTVHTTESLLVGAHAGMTTLTANRASVRAVVREMRRMKWRGVQGDVEGDVAGGDDHEKEDGDLVEEAVIWIIEPRSLAEGMRANMEEGGFVELEYHQRSAHQYLEAPPHKIRNPLRHG